MTAPMRLWLGQALREAPNMTLGDMRRRLMEEVQQPPALAFAPLGTPFKRPSRAVLAEPLPRPGFTMIRGFGGVARCNVRACLTKSFL